MATSVPSALIGRKWRRIQPYRVRFARRWPEYSVWILPGYYGYTFSHVMKNDVNYVVMFDRYMTVTQAWRIT